MRVKICGFTEPDALRELTGLGVDYCGFVFAESKRRVSAAEAAMLFRHVPAGVLKVGVFVNPSITELDDVMTAAPPDVIQLHGEESPAFCEEVKKRYGKNIFKAHHVKDNATVPAEGYSGVIDALLLDTYDGKTNGGTGKAFAWERIYMYYDWCEKRGLPLFVAGGINIENVSDLVSRYPLDGIDVSSGVESNGRKDMEKIRELVKRVRKNGTR